MSPPSSPPARPGTVRPAVADATPTAQSPPALRSGPPDHGTLIDDLERSRIVEDQEGAGVPRRSGVPQRRPGGAIDHEVAIGLHGRISARVAVGPRVPDDLAARAVFDEVAVTLHDQVVLA